MKAKKSKIDRRQLTQRNKSIKSNSSNPQDQPSPQIPAFRTPSTRASTLPNIVPNNSFFSSVVLHFPCLSTVTTVAGLSKFCLDGEVGEGTSKPISSHSDFVEINCDFEREWEEFEDDKLVLWP